MKPGRHVEIVYESIIVITRHLKEWEAGESQPHPQRRLPDKDAREPNT